MSAWRQKLIWPWSPLVLLAMGIAAFLVIELVIDTEEDPPAEAEAFHNCEMHIDNQLDDDLVLVWKDPTDPDRWGFDNPPGRVPAGSTADLDFKFRSDSNPRPASMSYQTAQEGGAPLKVTMSWECVAKTDSNPVAKNGNCSGAGGSEICAVNGLPPGPGPYRSYTFQLYDELPPPS